MRRFFFWRSRTKTDHGSRFCVSLLTMDRFALKARLPSMTNLVHPLINFPCRRRGDRNNLLFGGFYRLDVPLYDGTGNTAR